MTTTDLAAALLRGVPRHTAQDAASMTTHGASVWLHEDAVLAALTAALDGVDERAEEVLEGVTPGPWRKSGASINTKPDESAVSVRVSMGTRSREEAEDNARFIAWCREGVPALLAQIAALRAERDEWRKLESAAQGLSEVLDQHETKGPLPDTALMFCWLAAQNVRAVLRGYVLEKPE